MAQQTAIQKINRTNNIILYGCMFFLAAVGSAGVYGTLTSIDDEPVALMARRHVKRVRRRDEIRADSSGSGLKINAVATAE